MSKKMRRIAVLSLCIVMFAAVQPACARTWGDFWAETIGGGILGGVLGAAAVVVTGGAALPLVAGGAAAGALFGAGTEEQRAEMINGVAEDLANATVRGGSAAWNAPSGQKMNSFKEGFGQHFTETYPPVR